MCGFIQPSFVVEMLNRPDPDAFNDRQFFAIFANMPLDNWTSVGFSVD